MRTIRHHALAKAWPLLRPWRPVTRMNAFCDRLGLVPEHIHATGWRRSVLRPGTRRAA